MHSPNDGTGWSAKVIDGFQRKADKVTEEHQDRILLIDADLSEFIAVILRTTDAAVAIISTAKRLNNILRRATAGIRW
jgi:hypothetical protein